MRRVPIRRYKPLRAKSPKRPWRRKPQDRVPDWLPGYLYARDRSCVPARLGAPDPCSGRLTIEHVRDKDKPAMGLRAPNDPQHTVLACLGHNLGWCLTTAGKDAERDYLSRVELPESIW